LNAISNYSSYGKLLDSKAIDAMLLAWAKQLTAIANIVSEFVDLEDRLAICESDKNICTLSCFYQIFDLDLPIDEKYPNNRTFVGFARMAFLVEILAEEKV
jgi:hypothetical protein